MDTTYTDTTPEQTVEFPAQYLHVRECRTGQAWIVPLRGNALLDLRHQLTKWIKDQYCGELRLDGPLMPRLEGDYYAAIYTDHRSPDCGIVWESGGFYLKSA